MSFVDYLQSLNFEYVLFLRIGASIFFAFLLGLEREITGKFAGLRTHILAPVFLRFCRFTPLKCILWKELRG